MGVWVQQIWERPRALPVWIFRREILGQAGSDECDRRPVFPPHPDLRMGDVANLGDVTRPEAIAVFGLRQGFPRGHVSYQDRNHAPVFGPEPPTRLLRRAVFLSVDGHVPSGSSRPGTGPLEGSAAPRRCRARHGVGDGFLIGHAASHSAGTPAAREEAFPLLDCCEKVTSISVSGTPASNSPPAPCRTPTKQSMRCCDSGRTRLGEARRWTTCDCGDWNRSNR